ncbi:MAG: aldehyde ferredoxin oxidoreductase C-terminal domain-containing protein, partial [Chloroflexi bacterium]|nr:aldehyde ferredoxin oxidoreductase C-terminal domain-containing protein [Chloroflexota bacterium]
GTEWEDQEKGQLHKFFQAHLPRRTGCFGCPMRCMNNYSIPGLGAGVVSCQHYTELSWKLRNSDLDAWWQSVVLCQQYGIDSISVSGMIAWSMELYQRGIIDEKDTDGIPMAWGDRRAILGTIEKIANREGFGDVLAGDVPTAVKAVGRGSEEYMMHVKGSPLYVLNSRNFKGRALAAAVGPRGDHIRSSPALAASKAAAEATIFDPIERETAVKAIVEHIEGITGTPLGAEPLGYEGKAALVLRGENAEAIADMLLNCKWHTTWAEMPFTAELSAELLTAGTGRPWTADYLLNRAARLRAIERVYDVREGLTRDHDTLPKRFFGEPYSGRFSQDTLDREKFERMKDEYYELRGWDRETGVPSREYLESLGLKSIADELDRLGKLPAALPLEAAVMANS